MRTPEQYFEDHVFDSVTQDAQKHFTDEEKTFLDRYLGKDVQGILKNITAIGDKEAGESACPLPEIPANEPKGGKSALESEEAASSDVPREEEELEYYQETVVQMVSFRINDQEFALPISKVKEVIRYQEPTRLPASPDYIEGIINLRGRVTPMVRLAWFLDNKNKDASTRFIIVCRHKGLQIGLMIDSIATMYRIAQKDIEWGAESNLGANCDLVEGVVKGREKLIAVISVDRLSKILINS